MPQGDKLLTQAEYSRHRGCSREAVRKAVDAGRITAFGPDKLIDATLADAQWQRNTRARASTKAPPAAPVAGDDHAGAGGSYHDWRTRREAAEAQAAEMRLREQAGELVRADAVRHAHAHRLAGLREALLQIPARLAPVLAAETDQRAVHDALQAELYGVMREAAGGH
jgi:hypothetical protein